MRIAIVSNMKLPDTRVERQIYTFLKHDYEVHYIGRYRGETGIVDLSKVNIHVIEGWNHRVNLKIPPYYQWMKRRVARILSRIRPDVVLAPNVYVGIMIHELGYPVVIDDRENYSFKRYIGLHYIDSHIRRSLQLLYVEKTKKFEEELAANHPILTVTKPGYTYYKYDLGASKVYLVRNFPLRKEAEGLPSILPEKDKIVFNYIGKEISEQFYDKLGNRYLFLNYHRIIKQTIQILYNIKEKYPNIKLLVIGDSKLKNDHLIQSTGYVKHVKLYNYIRSTHYGLYSYYPSIYHQFVSSFRVYMYMLMGIPVLITSTFKDIIETVGNHCIVIDEHDYQNELYTKTVKIIELFSHDDYIETRKKIQEYAIKNTIWDNNEENIIHAIRLS